MPRIPRGALDGHVLHLLNRGNGRATVFHRASDYRSFVQLLQDAKRRSGMCIYAFAVLPNHFHLVGRSPTAGALSAFMQWWLTSHVRRHHRAHVSSGHVWQGRFKSFPVQEDSHLLTVLRYTLLNPVRANLAATAWEWPWTSLSFPDCIDPWPLSPPRDLSSWLREGVSEADTVRMRQSLERRTPFGAPTWQKEVAKRAGLESTLQPRGRPPRRTDLSAG